MTGPRSPGPEAVSDIDAGPVALLDIDGVYAPYGSSVRFDRREPSSGSSAVSSAASM